MKKALWMLPLVVLTGLFGFIQKPAEPATATEINWVSVEEAAQLASRDGKKILIDVYTDWCGWCKKMDKATYANAEVVNYINENYHAVKFDAEQRENVDLNGKTFKYVAQGRRGYHELAAALLQGKLAYPATVFLDSDLSMLTNVPGYRGPQDMMAFLSYFKEEKYNDGVSLQNYLDGYGKSR